MKKLITTLPILKQVNLLVFFFVLLSGSLQAIDAQANCHASFTVTTTNLTAAFTDASSSDHTITSWSWDFGDGQTSTDQNPMHVYAVADTYLVCLTIHDDHGCTSTLCHHVEVHATQTNCHASFTFHTSGLTVNFADASTADGIISSWFWDFGDGYTSTDQNPFHTYSSNGTYHICLTIHDSHGCTSTYCHDVTVHIIHHHCHASFTFSSDSTGLFFHFTNTSTGTTSTTTYSWDFGDGTTSNDENPTHTYNHHGHYTVCLFISDTATGCSSHFCHMVNAHAHYHTANHSQVLYFNAGDEGQERFAAYPNPFSEVAIIEYSLTQPSVVTIEMDDLLGNKVFELANLNETEGTHTHSIEGNNFTTGLYLLKLTINGQTTMKKIAVSK